MIMFHRLLRNVGQHGIRAAESDDGGFAEKDSFAKNRVIGSEKNSGKRQRQRPDHNPSRRNLERAKPCWFRATGKVARKIAIQRMRDFAAKILGQNPATDKSENAGTDDNQRKWDVEKIDGDKSGQSERPHDSVLERLASDPNDGRGDDGKNGRFQPVKDRRDPGNISKRDINVTERPKNKDRRNN